MEIGIHTFASANFKDKEGKQIPENQAINELLDRIEHADKIGIDEVGIGEHHRKEFLDSAAHITLAAAAAITKNIRLTSSVTVLSATDPVRVFQNFDHWPVFLDILLYLLNKGASYDLITLKSSK